MYIVALYAGNPAEVALLDGKTIVARTQIDSVRVTETMLPAVVQLLKKQHLLLSDVCRALLYIGPGSYTAIRAACSIATGLQMTHNIAVRTVSWFELTAFHACLSGQSSPVRALYTDSISGASYFQDFNLAGEPLAPIQPNENEHSLIDVITHSLREGIDSIDLMLTLDRHWPLHSSLSTIAPIYLRTAFTPAH